MRDKNKINTGFTLNNDIIENMDELLNDIGNTNRSRYIEKLIREDFDKRGIKVTDANIKQKTNINEIFEKIATLGLPSLTKEELDILSSFSKEVDEEDMEKRKNRIN